MDVLRYAAFTDDPAGGNPAGVVIADALPADVEMQRIAAEVGFSETAFIAAAAGPEADRDIRYFSPEAEVAFCGHATIATAVALAERDPGLAGVTFATRTDRIPVSVRRANGRLAATLTSPPTSQRDLGADLLDELLGLFGWTDADLDPSVPPVVAHAGVDHPVLALADRGTLAAMAYPFEDLKELMLREGWTTVALLWRESETRFHARDPFPVGGVVEDPATGAAAAAVGGYLRDAGILPGGRRITIVQGVDMGRPSLLEVDLLVDRPGIDVSGTAVVMP